MGSTSIVLVLIALKRPVLVPHVFSMGPYTHCTHTVYTRGGPVKNALVPEETAVVPVQFLEGPRPFLVGSTAQEFRALCSSCLCANYRLARKSSKSNCGLNGLLPMYLHEGSLLVEGGSEYDSGLEGDHPLKVV